MEIKPANLNSGPTAGDRRAIRQSTGMQAPAFSRTRFILATIVVYLFWAFGAASAFASGSVLSGKFDGTEAVIDPLWSSACEATRLAYQQTAFEVSASGSYYFNDAFGSLRQVGGLDVTALVYEGSFNAAAPGQNLVASADVDYPASEVTLTAGITYTLVVQLACAPSKGVWAVMFAGPGRVESRAAVALPSFSSGAFRDGDPLMTSNCGDAWGPYDAYYQQSGPIRVSRDGTYYFATAGIYGLCLSIYSAPVNPAWDKGWINFVGGGYQQGVELKAGQDYYILAQSYADRYGTQPNAVEAPGEYFFVLAPPAPFRINFGLADSWYNPDNPGQGVFLDVLEATNQIFMAWFTYALEPEVNDDFGHRWMTAIGPIAGTSGTLVIDQTDGGVFDAAEPAPAHAPAGAIELEFSDCSSGQIRYDLAANGPVHPGASGVIPIERIVDDAVGFCESLYAGPGIPGPL
jgi:hypothetical protein